MEVVAQKLGAAQPSVSVEQGKVLDLFGALWVRGVELWVSQVKHNRNAVLVVVPHDSVVRVGPVVQQGVTFQDLSFRILD